MSLGVRHHFLQEALPDCLRLNQSSRGLLSNRRGEGLYSAPSLIFTFLCGLSVILPLCNEDTRAPRGPAVTQDPTAGKRQNRVSWLQSPCPFHVSRLPAPPGLTLTSAPALTEPWTRLFSPSASQLLKHGNWAPLAGAAPGAFRALVPSSRSHNQLQPAPRHTLPPTGSQNSTPRTTVGPSGWKRRERK